MLGLRGEQETETLASVPPIDQLLAREGDFLWRSLQRLGVREGDCADVLQGVLLTIHQRAGSFDARAPLRAWLYGICLRHAAAYRRKAWVRREVPTEAAQMPQAEACSVNETPESAMVRQQGQARLEALLDELDEDKRALLVMYEVEELSCEQLAELLGVPLGTVHSRLSAARKAFRAALDRRTARERTGGHR